LSFSLLLIAKNVPEFGRAARIWEGIKPLATPGPFPYFARRFSLKPFCSLAGLFRDWIDVGW
jgi:hypothetical protein